MDVYGLLFQYDNVNLSSTGTTLKPLQMFYILMFYVAELAPENTEKLTNITDLIKNRHYACVGTRKDDTETFKHAFEHLCQIIHSDSTS